MTSEDAICMAVVMIIAVMAVPLTYVTRLKKVPPEKAMVVYGRKMAPGIKKGYMIVTKGTRLIMPIIESVEFLDLSPITIRSEFKDLRMGLEGYFLQVMMTSTVRIPNDGPELDVAAETLLHRTAEEVERFARNILEGTMVAVVRGLEDPGLEGKPYLVSDMVREVASLDLMNLGIEIEQLTVDDLRVRERGGA